MDAEHPSKKIFSYEEALALLPKVRELTEEAYRRVEELGEAVTAQGVAAEDARAEVDLAVREWAGAVIALGVEIKGLWLVDFDNGNGYYCWRYPEAGLQYYHSYEEGFAGRIRIH